MDVTDIDVLPAVSDPRRLAELDATGLLEPGPVEAFDRITALTQRILDVPAAFVTLVDRDRQVFKSEVGLNDDAPDVEVPLANSICQYAVATGDRLVIDDTARNRLVRHSPSVTEDGMAAYAGVPLTTEGGQHLGALCIIDHRPREWMEWELELLADLSFLAAAEINHRLRASRIAALAATAVRLEEPLASLATAMASLGEAADRLDDPQLSRVTAQARSRMTTVTTLSQDLREALSATPVADIREETVDLADRARRAARIAVASTGDDNVTVHSPSTDCIVRARGDELDRSLSAALVAVLNHAPVDTVVACDVRADAASVVLEVHGPGRAMPVSELTRIVSRLHAACGGEGDAAVRSGGGATAVESGPVRATTGPDGNRVQLHLPAVAS